MKLMENSFMEGKLIEFNVRIINARVADYQSKRELNKISENFFYHRVPKYNHN